MIKKVNLVKFTPTDDFPLYRIAQSDYTYDDDYENQDVNDVIFDDKVTLWIDIDYNEPRNFEMVFHHLVRQGYKPIQHNGEGSAPITMSKGARITGIIDQVQLNQDAMINQAVGESNNINWNRIKTVDS